MDKLKIFQLGNSGGLDFEKPSTAFLIQYSGASYVLLDAGHRILERASQIISENSKVDRQQAYQYITHVLITHTHFDHIADLETLIYLKYFGQKQPLHIVTSNVVSKDLRRFLPDGYIYTDCKAHKTKLYNLIEINHGLYLAHNVFVQPFKVWHPPVKATGYVVFNTTTNNCAIFTGDTKALKSIEELYNELKEDYNVIAIFHDYSYYNFSCNNIHTCESDFIGVYSSKFREKVIKVHTGTDELVNLEI